jgi:hypothetical protein
VRARRGHVQLMRRHHFVPHARLKQRHQLIGPSHWLGTCGLCQRICNFRYFGGILGTFTGIRFCIFGLLCMCFGRFRYASFGACSCGYFPARIICLSPQLVSSARLPGGTPSPCSTACAGRASCRARSWRTRRWSCSRRLTCPGASRGTPPWCSMYKLHLKANLETSRSLHRPKG